MNPHGCTVVGRDPYQLVRKEPEINAQVYLKCQTLLMFYLFR